MAWSLSARTGLLLVVLVFFAGTSTLFFPFTADDAFIVARYAINARDLGEWVFNAGERVSALTSPLHGLIMIALAFVASDPLPVYKVVALTLVVAASLMCLASFGLSRREAPVLAALLAGRCGDAAHRACPSCGRAGLSLAAGPR